MATGSTMPKSQSWRQAVWSNQRMFPGFTSKCKSCACSCKIFKAACNCRAILRKTSPCKGPCSFRCFDRHLCPKDTAIHGHGCALRSAWMKAGNQARSACPNLSNCWYTETSKAAASLAQRPLNTFTAHRRPLAHIARKTFPYRSQCPRPNFHFPAQQRTVPGESVWHCMAHLLALDFGLWTSALHARSFDRGGHGSSMPVVAPQTQPRFACGTLPSPLQGELSKPCPFVASPGDNRLGHCQKASWPNPSQTKQKLSVLLVSSHLWQQLPCKLSFAFSWLWFSAQQAWSSHEAASKGHRTAKLPWPGWLLSGRGKPLFVLGCSKHKSMCYWNSSSVELLAQRYGNAKRLKSHPWMLQIDASTTWNNKTCF